MIFLEYVGSRACLSAERYATKPDNEQTSPTNSMICGTFFYSLVSALMYIFSSPKRQGF